MVQAASSSISRSSQISISGNNSISQALVSTMPHSSANNLCSAATSNITSNLFPMVPSNHRSNQSWYFHNFDNFQFQLSNIAAVPLSSQENLLLHDLIYCLTGVRGSYITPELVDSSYLPSAGDCRAQFPLLKFKISDQIHSSLRDIAQEILPLAGHHGCILQFIQKANFSDCSQVLQALSGALNSLIHDYYVSIIYLSSFHFYFYFFYNF